MAQRGELIVDSGPDSVDVPLLLMMALTEWGYPRCRGVLTGIGRRISFTDALEEAGVPPAALVLRGMGFKDGSPRM